MLNVGAVTVLCAATVAEIAIAVSSTRGHDIPHFGLAAIVAVLLASGVDASWSEDRKP